MKETRTPEQIEKALSRAITNCEDHGWRHLRKWYFQSPSGSVHDLSGADLSKLEMIESEGLCLAGAPVLPSGPYKVRPGNASDAHYNVYDKDGNFLAHDDGTHCLIAGVLGAAPCLLDALQECLDALKCHTGDATAQTQARAKAAIKLARNPSAQS